MSEATLYEKILARAKTDAVNSVELRVMAGDLDKAIAGSSTAALVGTWARVRRRWCEITGEPLVPHSTVRTAVAILARRNVA